MFTSAALCRTQEAHQRARAASARLENVRIIATRAAAAWANEARAAERREERRASAPAPAGLAAAENRCDAEHDRLLSENPDRGFEST